MGKKDIVDKPYFSDCERFAELMNAALYHGQMILRPEDLVLQRRKYLSLANACSEVERDVLMMDIRRNIYYGMEIETESDYSMPQRVMTYDVCEYEYQVKGIDRGHRDKKDYRSYCERKSRMKERDFLLPIITVVLYLKEGHWKGRRKLSQMFRVSMESRELLRDHLPEYVFPLIEADYVNPIDYGTDLREFFQAMQCRRDKGKLKALLQTERFQNLSQETESVIATHLHISGLTHKMKKEEQSMCKAFYDLMRDERREGKREGRKEGKKEERIRIIKKMITEGFDEALIRRMTRCTGEEYAAAGKMA